MTILYDIVDPVVLTTFARLLPEPTGVALHNILPDVLVDDVKAVWDEVTQTNRAAMFRSWDAATPVGQRDSMTRKSVKMLPVSQQTQIGELETIELNMLRGMNADALIQEIYNDTEINANAVRTRVEVARGDVLSDWVVSISENGVVQTYDYGVPAGHQITGGATWATTSTDIPSQVEAAMDIWSDAGGGDAVLTVSRTTLRHMLSNEKYRALATVYGVTLPSLALADINAAHERRGLPQVQVYNSSFSVAGSTTRAIPIDVAIITPANAKELGYTAWGITAEALTLAKAQRLPMEAAPGLVAVNTETDEPVGKWTKVTGVPLPVLTNPRRLVTIDTIP